MDVLARYPVTKITIGRFSQRLIAAEYHARNRTITINSARKLGFHFGEDFVPGLIQSMSRAATDRLESRRRSLLHEIAHHLACCVPELEALVLQTIASANCRPITAYARRSSEYFAESFVAFFVCHAALQGHDPAGCTMVEKSLALLRSHLI